MFSNDVEICLQGQTAYLQNKFCYFFFLNVRIKLTIWIWITRLLERRISQHVPASIKRCQSSNNLYNFVASGLCYCEAPDKNCQQVLAYWENMFSVLCRFHLQFHCKVLEIIFLKSRQPFLYKYKECHKKKTFGTAQ